MKRIAWFSFFVVLNIMLIFPPCFADVNKELFDAVEQKDIQQIDKLLSAGADINAKDSNGKTPFMYAWEGWLKGYGSNDAATMKFLVDKGADVDTKDSNGKTPLIYALEGSSYNNTAMTKFLVDKGADVNAKDSNGKTPLIYELRKGSYSNTATIKFLVDKGANVNTKDSNGKTPLFYALGGGSYRGKAATIKLLVDKGADVNAKDSEGTTPLMYAVEYYSMVKAKSDIGAIKFLMQKGANVNVKNVDGYTAWSYTIDPEIEALLLVNGAKKTKKAPEEWRAARKPVIYLYPLTEQKVSVRLKYKGDIFVSYPKYDNNIGGWDVTAYPDGKIINSSDNLEYSYLFWEGKPDKPIECDFSKGFVIEGEKTAEFLQGILKKLGLAPKEYNEFIVYWFPRMKDNKYNLITFLGKIYEDNAQLEITPKPDSILRIFMVFKPIENKISIEPQEIKPFIRKGFTVVEWGGTEYK
jgi:ankyrin repeat protein